MPDVVVVESPAKAKTINKYLGSGFKVLASLGHVRDLPARDGSVRPEEDFAMDWEADPRGEKQVAAIAAALRNARRLYLATDPDREGEAISWHVRRMLEERNALEGVEVHRITFNEITRSAVQAALRHPRDLDQSLIEAYLARRALDYLVGFTLSPVLWRKLPGSRSAGRVQSVALRLICEREAEIETFRPREYWTVEADFRTPRGDVVTFRLTHLEGRKLEPFDLDSEAKARAAAEAIARGRFRVLGVERKRLRRHPPPPFTTSTLQQEASRKLGFSAKQTMRIAQQLYEGVDIGGETLGLITYMRTDGVQIAAEAVTALRRHIGETFGAPYLPDRPRLYQTKAKNAQEAHEAIRPTDVSLTPAALSPHLTPEQLHLYELIWKRALASQMASAEFDQMSVEIGDDGTRLRASGSELLFDGFLKLYREDRDEADAEMDEEGGRLLPPLHENEPMSLAGEAAIRPEQHFTQPPPRYSEASLVKKLEELGIGRPSTYATIISVLQERKYVRLERRRFVPEERGRLVTAFLVSFFNRYVDTGFTASLEEELDEISAGRKDWREVMRAFWEEFSKAVEETKGLKIADVIEALDQELAPHLFPPREDGTDPRRCPACGTGRLRLKLGRFGSFIGCSNYPSCQYTRKLTGSAEEGTKDSLPEGTRLLGHHPETGEEVFLRRGPYGLYVQLGNEAKDGEDEGKRKKKGQRPKRVALPPGWDGTTLSLERALALLALPRRVGLHPETGEPIEAGFGRFGPYVRMGHLFASLDADEDPTTVGLNRAVDALAKKSDSIRDLGPHPEDGLPLLVRKGRFGPYLQHGTTRLRLPRGTALGDIDREAALALLAARAEKTQDTEETSPAAAAGKAAGKKDAKKAKKAEAPPSRKKAAGTKAASPSAKARGVRAAQKTAPKKSAAAGKAAESPPAKGNARRSGASLPRQESGAARPAPVKRRRVSSGEASS
jgi:DNA topoisomerase-1